MIDLADNEARHLAILYRRMMRELDRALAPYGIGHGRYTYVFALYIEDDRTQQSLADSLGADKAAAARALARLEADGYVERRADASDGRVSRVQLTPKGRALRPDLEEAAMQTIALIVAPLAAAERRELRCLLRKMVLGAA